MYCIRGEFKKPTVPFLLAVFRNAYNNIILTGCLVIQLTYTYFNSTFSLITCHQLVYLLELSKIFAIVCIRPNCEL